jgi:hypothetical protein
VRKLWRWRSVEGWLAGRLARWLDGLVRKAGLKRIGSSARTTALELHRAVWVRRGWIWLQELADSVQMGRQLKVEVVL